MTQPKIEGVGHGIPRMLYASDGSNWYALKVRDSGILEVCSKSGDKIFGLESIVNDYVTTTFAGGSTQAVSGAVPIGKIWLITAVSVRPLSRAATSILGGVLRDSSGIYLFYDSDGVAQWYISPFYSPMYLDASDKIFADIGGGQNGDQVTLYYNGYQMNAP